MVKEEIAQRLFYVDKLYDEKKLSDKNPEEIKVIIDNIKKEVNSLTLEEIKERVGANMFLKRLEGKYCRLIEVNLDKLCVCDIHQLQFRTMHTFALRGEILINIINNLNTETEKRINSIKSITKKLISEMPPIVRKYGDKFEVLMGNHRIMASILNGEKTFKVLCICDRDEAQDFPNIDFHSND